MEKDYRRTPQKWEQFLAHPIRMKEILDAPKNWGKSAENFWCSVGVARFFANS